LESGDDDGRLGYASFKDPRGLWAIGVPEFLNFGGKQAAVERYRQQVGYAVVKI